jgi:hypothetical protein
MSSSFFNQSIFIFFLLFLTIIHSIYLISSNKSNIFFKFTSIILIFYIFIFFFFYSGFKYLFLPFLNISAFPPSLIPSTIHPPNTNFSIELDFNYPNGTKIIYWASNKHTGNHPNNDYVYSNPYDAYGDYKNSGVTVVNNKKAVLSIHCPDKYNVNMGYGNKTLDKHIHYRIATPNNPILSDVKTIFINC